MTKLLKEYHQGSVAAGGLIETYSDVQENLDISDVLKKKVVFALTVNGDSMIDAFIAHGDMVLMEPIKDAYLLRMEILLVQWFQV